ncbi:MAG: hypothetical protein NTV51_22360 [Verrucomicrobia bacterium]|nr:hypothetical protein [Verrucomicrobiota bacterium]
MKSTIRLLPLLAFSMLASATHAGTIALSVTPLPGATGTHIGDSGVIGWSFTANSNLTVTDLGFYDFRGNGFVESH